MKPWQALLMLASKRCNWTPEEEAALKAGIEALKAKDA